MSTDEARTTSHTWEEMFCFDCEANTSWCDHPSKERDVTENNDEVRTTSATGGQKGVKPQRFDLIPVVPLTILAELYGFGAMKYADRNWEKGYEWSKSYAALQRHATAWWGGEDFDPESGLSHMASVAWHAFALLEFMSRPQQYGQYDDRPRTSQKPGSAHHMEQEPSGTYFCTGCSWFSRAEHFDDVVDSFAEHLEGDR